MALRLVAGLAVASIFSFVASPPAGAAGCTDAAAVARTRAQADAQCDCASAGSHGAYVSCVAGVADAAVAAKTLPPECRGAVVRCAARSTCGRPGAVACCRTNAKGVTKCTIKNDAAACKAPKGGTSCVGAFASCCDACVNGGCATTTTTSVPTTTSAPTSSTSTTMAPPCTADRECGACQNTSDCGGSGTCFVPGGTTCEHRGEGSVCVSRLGVICNDGCNSDADCGPTMVCIVDRGGSNTGHLCCPPCP